LPISFVLTNSNALSHFIGMRACTSPAQSRNRSHANGAGWIGIYRRVSGN
jgi:hypothetical protein